MDIVTGNISKVLKVAFWTLITVMAQSAFAASTGTIRGKVLDKESKAALPGANILVKGTNIGAATDLNGSFIVNNAPSGEQVLVVSYVGYASAHVEVDVPPNGVLTKNIYLEPTAIKGKTVVVTGQAQGQLQSINQELSSDRIVNVVSSEKMKELPDANIAESIGRLPGVSLQRDNGEADAVIIRGLAPQYNQVEIEGVPMSSTYWGNRGVDLSLLGDELIAGVTVSKTLSANMDPNALGGTVDMTLKTADPGLHYSFRGNGGYNHLRDSYNNYKLSLSAGDRFFNNKLGVLVLGNFELKQLPSDQFNANYADQIQTGRQIAVMTQSAELTDNTTQRHRYGISLILDYKSPSMDVKFFNILDEKVDSSVIRDYTTYFTSNNFLDQVFVNNTRTIQETHSLQFLFRIAGTKLPISFSYNRGQQETPDGQEFDFEEQLNAAPLQPSQLIYGRPATLVNAMGVMTPSTPSSVLWNIFHTDPVLKDNSYYATADWHLPFRVSNSVSGVFSAGGKYSYENRVSSNSRMWYDIQYGGSRGRRINLFNAIPFLAGANPDFNSSSGIQASYFVDPNYTRTGILGYPIGPGYDPAKLSYMENVIFPAWKSVYYTDGVGTFNQDYTDNEYTSAGYVMVSLNIGNRLTIVPGVRYQEERTNISAFHIRINGSNANGLDGTPPQLIDTRRDNPNWYPSVNVKYKLTDNVNLIGAVYKSESLPSYSEISPLVELQDGTGVLVTGNPLLKPSTAWNFDLGTSVHSNAIGLFTVDVFYKEISNLIYQVPNFYAFYPYPIENAPANLSSLLPARSYYDTTWANNLSRLHIYGSIPMNDPYKAFLRGAEFSWQTNLWYLPGLLSGLVLNLNMSLMSSNELYPSFQPVKTLFGSIDSLRFTTTGGRLQDQPSLVYNAILGWDHQGFSARLSASYQGLTLQSMDTQYGLQDSYYDRVLLIDISLKQKIVGNLAVFANVTNINNHIDSYYYSHPSYVNGSNTYPAGQLPTSEQTYSWNAQLGITFNY